MKENQNIEFKESWRDEYLKWICGFANAQGGTLFIGVDDKGNIIGVESPKKLLEDLPNKIKNILGIIATVNLHTEQDKSYLEIKIDTYHTPISYKGHFYYRSGSTNQELNGPSLEKFLLNKMGRKWDGIPATGFTEMDLDSSAFEIFRKKAKKSKRIPNEDIEESDSNLIKILGLSYKSELKRSAVILFGNNPENLITGAYMKIGFFRTDTDLLFQDEVHGSLFHQVEKTMDLLLTKYTKANISYEGWTRTETYDYPENALREAVINALIHKDYSSGNPIQISVYSEWLMIWNAGSLPQGWTTETLLKKHISEPANPDIAEVFFRAGFIEAWGRGTMNIIKYCVDANLPEPVFEDKWGGLAVIFKTQKKISEINDQKSNQKSDQKSDQKPIRKTEDRILELLELEPNLGRAQISERLGNISESGVQKQLAKLIKRGKIKRIGPDKGGYWQINKA